jgi:hypothetical protein
LSVEALDRTLWRTPFGRGYGLAVRQRMNDVYVFILNKWLSKVSYILPGYFSRYSSWLRSGQSEDRIPLRARFSTPIHTLPEAHTTSYKISFRGVNRPESGANHAPPSKAEVKERVELYLHCPLQPSTACSRAKFSLFILQFTRVKL